MISVGFRITDIESTLLFIGCVNALVQHTIFICYAYGSCCSVLLLEKISHSKICPLNAPPQKHIEPAYVRDVVVFRCVV